VLRLAGTALLVSLLASTASAQQAEPEPDQRELSARQLFAVGKYTEALEIYGKLFAETAHPTYLRNVGRCYQNLGEADKAISSFREYLRQAKDLPPDQRALIERYIREMQDLKRQQEAARRPSTDAKAESPAPPPAPASAPALISETPANDSGAAAPPSRLPAYIVGGASVAVLGVGAYFGLRALSEKNAADPLCPMDKCTGDGYTKNEAAVRDARITDFVLGAGIVGIGVATYLYLRNPAGDGAPQPAPTARLRFLPTLGPGLAKVSAEAHW
jgi:hypothetical protein